MSQIPGPFGMPGNDAYLQSGTNQSNDAASMFGGARRSAEQQPSANNNGTFEQHLKRRPRSYSRHRPPGGRQARYPSSSRSRSRSRDRRYGHRRNARSRSPRRESSYRHRHRGRSRSPMMRYQSRHSGVREAARTALEEAIAEREQTSKKMADAVAANKQLPPDACAEAELEALIPLHYVVRDCSNAMSKESILRGDEKAILLATQDQFEDLGKGNSIMLFQQMIEKEQNKARFARLENEIVALRSDVATLVQLLSNNSKAGSGQV